MTIYENQTREELISDIKKYSNDYDKYQIESVYNKSIDDLTKEEAIQIIDSLFD